jgi:hypothetical protein
MQAIKVSEMLLRRGLFVDYRIGTTIVVRVLSSARACNLVTEPNASNLQNEWAMPACWLDAWVMAAKIAQAVFIILDIPQMGKTLGRTKAARYNLHAQNERS